MVLHPSNRKVIKINRLSLDSGFLSCYAETVYVVRCYLLISVFFTMLQELRSSSLFLYQCHRLFVFCHCKSMFLIVSNTTCKSLIFLKLMFFLKQDKDKFLFVYVFVVVRWFFKVGLLTLKLCVSNNPLYFSLLVAAGTDAHLCNWIMLWCYSMVL